MADYDRDKHNNPLDLIHGLQQDVNFLSDSDAVAERVAPTLGEMAAKLACLEALYLGAGEASESLARVIREGTSATLLIGEHKANISKIGPNRCAVAEALAASSTQTLTFGEISDLIARSATTPNSKSNMMNEFFRDVRRARDKESVPLYEFSQFLTVMRSRHNRSTWLQLNLQPGLPVEVDADALGLEAGAHLPIPALLALAEAGARETDPSVEEERAAGAANETTVEAELPPGQPVSELEAQETGLYVDASDGGVYCDGKLVAEAGLEADIVPHLPHAGNVSLDTLYDDITQRAPDVTRKALRGAIRRLGHLLHQNNAPVSIILQEGIVVVRVLGEDPVQQEDDVYRINIRGDLAKDGVRKLRRWRRGENPRF